MEIFKSLARIERTGTVSIFSQVSKGVVDLIQRGILKPGDKLPSVRKMAKTLAIHPRTVVAAYSDLEAQEWIQTIARRGFYISSVLPIIRPIRLHAKGNADRQSPLRGAAPLIEKPEIKVHRAPSLIIDDGFPDHRLAPMESILREYRRLMRDRRAIRMATFGENRGSDALRKVLSKFLRDTRALPVDEDNLCITRGAQMGLYLICRTYLKKGSTVLVAEPNYPYANSVFQECGAQLIRVPVEHDGIDVSHIARICAKKKPDMIYLIPHHHHPTTVTLSPQKRIALLELVEKFKLLVIEDDYDYDFHYDTSPILPLSSYVKGHNIFYLGSLSKSIANTLRIGFVCASPEAIESISRLRRLVDLRGDTFFELAIGNFIKDGEFARHLKRMNRIYRERRDVMYDLLKSYIHDGITVVKPSGGMAFWTTFDKSIDLKILAMKAREKGLLISDGTFYNTSKINLNSTRFGFASKDEKEIYQIVDTMRTIIKR
jgi:GntR family transcriptional regulator/MocR family aminotransferase